MLNAKELEQYFLRHQLSEAAREYIHLVRQAPSRLTGTNARSNICTWFVSSKTQLTIQTESRTVEYAFALEFECSNDVLEFWDQLQPISVRRTYTNGKKCAGSYTPDFLLLTRAGPVIVETKHEDEIHELLQKNPADWERTEAGVTYRPTAEAFQSLGLVFRVRSTAEFTPIRTANLKLLLQARRAPDVVTPQLINAVEKILARRSWLRLSALSAELDRVDLTPLVQMIDRGLLHAALSEELISQPASTWVTLSAECLALRKALSAERCGYESLTCDVTRLPVDQAPTEKQALRGLQNLKRLKNHESSRSARRWRKKLRESAKTKNEFLTVAPRWDQCGNRTARLHERCVALLKDFIRTEYATPKRLGEKKGYALYKELVESIHPHLPAVSRTTFSRYLAKADQREIGQGRGGRRAANAAAEPTPVEKRQLKAARAFEVGMMDHYKGDILCRLVGANGTAYSLRPWISVLIDLYSRFVLALWLSFRAPSTRTCAMLIRLCVRKHGRLTEDNIVDRGAEFQSVYFHALNAHCGVNLGQRPAEHPRYGGEMERLFGLFKTQWLSMRPGNLVHFREARAVSRSHSPSAQATLTIEQLLAELLAFVDWHNANIVGLQDSAPSELIRTGLAQFSCSGRPIEYDQRFIVASAVDVKKYSIDPARGIHTDDGLHYWHPALKKLAGQRRPTEVRKEPENPYRVYAKVGSEWVTCLAPGEVQFQALDPVARLAQAVRVLDGREAREIAKNEADRRLIKRMHEFDQTWSAQKTNGIAPTASTNEQNQSKLLFAELRNTKLVSLKPTNWR